MFPGGTHTVLFMNEISGSALSISIVGVITIGKAVFTLKINKYSHEIDYFVASFGLVQGMVFAARMRYMACPRMGGAQSVIDRPETASRCSISVDPFPFPTQLSP